MINQIMDCKFQSALGDLIFEVDRHHIVVAALSALSRSGEVDAGVVATAISRYELDGEAPPPWTQ